MYDDCDTIQTEVTAMNEAPRYFAPLDRALGHMRAMLFHPFSAKKWLVIAFSAWLANLGTAGNGSSTRWDPSDAVREAWGASDVGLLPPGLEGPFTEWGRELGLLGLSAALIAALLVGLVLLGLLVLWISSRAKFVFLECVVDDAARIREPWIRYRHEGNSLFLWRLSWIAGSITVAALVGGGLAFTGGLAGWEWSLLSVLMLAAVALAIATPIAYIFLWVESFVLPIMMRRRIGILDAIEELWGLLSQDFIPFLLYGLFYLFLLICVLFLVIALAVLTCGLGGILMLLPYIGAVLLLPVSITLRAYSLAWLEQIEPKYGLSG